LSTGKAKEKVILETRDYKIIEICSQIPEYLLYNQCMFPPMLVDISFSKEEIIQKFWWNLMYNSGQYNWSDGTWTTKEKKKQRNDF